MTSYRYEKPDRIYLFGGGRILSEFADWLVSKSYAVTIYTAPRQRETLPQHHYLGDTIICDDINTQPLFCVTEKSLGICFGPAWNFGDHLRNLFGDRLIDFMSIPYPRYQGGAHETWAELVEEKTWGCCLQLVTPNTKQGECHDGEVILRSAFDYADRHACFLTFLQLFIVQVKHGATFAPVTQDQERVYYPRLNTAANGWIDWSWTAHEISRFINAFAAYGGAGTYVHEVERRLRGASLRAHGGMHPYAAGLVLDIGPMGALIACRDGTLVVQLDDQGAVVHVGDRLHTPAAVLASALLYRPAYDAGGDAKARSPAPPVTPDSRPTAPLRIELLAPTDVTQGYVDWLNDPAVNRFLEVRHRHWIRQDCEDYVAQCVFAPNIALLGIYLGDRHIGNVKIGPVDAYHRHADISYFIGEKSLWGKGYGTEAVNLAAAYAFERMHVHRLQAGIYDSNGASEQVLLKAGFTQDAVFKQQLLMDGEWEDHIWFSKINPEWTA